METNTQIIISLLTIIGSGVVSAFITQKLVTSRSEKEFKRKKIEELFLSVHKYCRGLSVANMVWPEVAAGKINYNEAIDIVTKSDKSSYLGAYESSEMIVKLYFPHLEKDFDKILLTRKEIGFAKLNLKRDYENQSDLTEYVSLFNKLLIQIENVEKEFKNSIANERMKIK